jgi:ATPase subunit of ABC transporter with duplicated ATPase domains
MPAPALPLEQTLPATAEPPAFAIEFENVCIAFDENVVLDGVSFRLPHGETKALFGVAGSGKSVLLKLALGLLLSGCAAVENFLCSNRVTIENDIAALYATISERGLVSRLDHAAYLGCELARAEMSLKHGWEYYQDRAPGETEEKTP